MMKGFVDHTHIGKPSTSRKATQDSRNWVVYGANDGDDICKKNTTDVI